jgi:hypothetical protein
VVFDKLKAWRYDANEDIIVSALSAELLVTVRYADKHVLGRIHRIGRGSVMARIDPNREHPERRTFRINNLEDWTLRNRAGLLSAVLTLLRAPHDPRMPTCAIANT